MKKFSKFEIATIKRTAQNVNPMVTKKLKIKEQIATLQEEYDRLETMQEQYEASIRTMTGGYSTEDLVDKVVETTATLDKNGKAVKITKYVLKYPDTIVPTPLAEESAPDTEVEVEAEEVEGPDTSAEAPHIW